MKKQILALSLSVISVAAFAQKSEIKTAEKAIKNQQFDAALTAVNSVESLLPTMKSKYKANYYYLKAQALAGKNSYEEAANAFNDLFAYETEIGKQKYTKEAKPLLNQIIQKVSNLGSNLYNNDKNYKEASKYFALTHKLSPTDTTFLYNAAVSSSLGEDYETALTYYKQLLDLGYTGITTQYLATNKENNQVQAFPSKSQRDLMVKAGTYSNPEDNVTESKQASIVKNIAYTYVNLGKTEEAIEAIQVARKANPKDVNLILNEAQLYIKLEKMDKFGALMEEAVKLDPTNPTLFFNLGVVNANQGKNEKAIEFYNKAIELKPDYADAYMNIAASVLSKEQPIVEEMNKNLSNFKKYDELKEKQMGVYREALPFLEKADSLNRSLSTVKTLLNIYDTLEMEEKADALRPIFKEMRAN